MTDLIIKNGIVYDPLNGINGEKKTIYIRDGEIVEKAEESNSKIIDASGMIIMPGGVDIHSHIAGAKVNAGRVFRPEDHFIDPVPKTKTTRAGTGYSVPSTFITGVRLRELSSVVERETAQIAS